MDDLISRQAAIKAIEDLQDCYNGFSDTYDKACIIGVLEELPSAQRKGKWLPDNNNPYEMRFVCSECKTSEVVPTIGFTKYKPIWDFCPNCGAEMKGEETDGS